MRTVDDLATLLALKAGDGDVNALNRLIEATRPRMKPRIMKIVPVCDVDDVLQDVCLQLVQSVSDFKGKSSFTTWCHSISRNVICEYYRRKERAIRNESAYRSENPIESFTELQTDIEFEELLCQIPERYRVLLQWYIIEGRTIVEYAKLKNENWDAVWSRYRGAIKWCQSHLKELELER